jgi:hypothetical protein
LPRSRRTVGPEARLDRIRVDDQARGDVLGRTRQRARRVLVDGGAGEIFAPAAGFIQEHDDPVDEPVGGDNLDQKNVPSVGRGSCRSPPALSRRAVIHVASLTNLSAIRSRYHIVRTKSRRLCVILDNHV